MGKTSKGAVAWIGLTAILMSTLGATIAAMPARASTSVSSAGSVLPGGISAGTASFTLTENSISAFANASGTLTVTITDSASASTVHFTGSPVLSAPGSLGATVALGSGGSSFTVSTSASDTSNIEPITVSGLRIAADAGAASGAIQAALGGTLAGAVSSSASLGSPGTVGSGSSTQHLVFTNQPGGGGAGAVWAQQPVVAVRNASNQVVTGDNSTVVTLAIGANPAGGSLSCTSGLSRTVVNGIATFSGCSINIGSTSAYSLSATSSPVWTPATSSGFTISPTLQPVVLTDSIARGVNRGTAGFGTASIVVPRGGYITVLGTTSPNLSGAIVQVWTRTKTGAWHLLTSRIAAADGTVHVFARINAWTAFQLRFGGDAAHSPAASHGRIATAR